MTQIKRNKNYFVFILRIIQVKVRPDMRYQCVFVYWLKEAYTHVK